MNQPVRLTRDQMPKSLWREAGLHREIWSFYCPVCKAPRKLPHHPRPGRPMQIARIVLTTAFFMVVTWNYFGWKGMVAVFPFWAIYEVLFRLRVRAALRCPHCAFDPFLYAVDTDQARAEIESHYRRVFEEKGVPFPEKSAKNGGKNIRKPIRGIERVVISPAADPEGPASAEAPESPQVP